MQVKQSPFLCHACPHLREDKLRQASSPMDSRMRGNDVFREYFKTQFNKALSKCSIQSFLKEYGELIWIVE